MPIYRAINAGAVLAERLNDLADLRRRYALAGDPGMIASPFGRAVDLDGTGDYVNFGDLHDLTFGTGAADSAFSVSCWIKMDEATTFPVLGKGVYNTDAEWRLLVHSDDNLYFQTFDESVADCYIGQATAAVLTGYEGSWVHVAGTYDGSAVSAGFVVYVAGVAVTQGAAENNAGSYVAMEPLTHAVWLGRDGTNDADGAFRDVSVWPRVLTAAEVLALATHRSF